MLLLPDPGEALREHLAGVPEVTAIVGQRISLELRTDAPAIRYALIGGSEASWGEGTPLLSVECWGGPGPDDGTSWRLAATVAAAVESMAGPYAGGWVSDAVAQGHPYSSPDPTSGRARHIVNVRLWTYTLESTP